MGRRRQMRSVMLWRQNRAAVELTLDSRESGVLHSETSRWRGRQRVSRPRSRDSERQDDGLPKCYQVTSRLRTIWRLFAASRLAWNCSKWTNRKTKINSNFKHLQQLQDWVVRQVWPIIFFCRDANITSERLHGCDRVDIARDSYGSHLFGHCGHFQIECPGHKNNPRTMSAYCI